MEEQVRLMSGRFLQTGSATSAGQSCMFDFGPAASVETNPVAKFIVPDWGNKVNSGIGFRTGPPGFIGWRAGTTTLCQSRLYPPPPQSGTMNLVNATAHWSTIPQDSHCALPF
jgi:hypothetical protein